MECIAQGHVTGVTPYYAIVTSSSKRSLLDASKIRDALIELKIGTGIFSADTMAEFMLRKIQTDVALFLC